MFLLLHTNLPVTPPKRDKNEPKNDFFLPDLGGLTIIVKAIKFSSELEQKYDTKQENLLKSVKSGHFEVSPVKSGRFWKQVAFWQFALRSKAATTSSVRRWQEGATLADDPTLVPLFLSSDTQSVPASPQCSTQQSNFTNIKSGGRAEINFYPVTFRSKPPQASSM